MSEFVDEASVNQFASITRESRSMYRVLRRTEGHEDRRRRYVFVLALAAAVLFPMATEAGPLDALEDDLHSGRVDQIRVLHLAYDAHVRTVVTPEILERVAGFQTTIHLDVGTRQELLENIESCEVRPASAEADLRWGVLFLDQRGVRLHAIYLDGRRWFFLKGRRGLIDEISVVLDDTWVSWLEGRFPGAVTGPYEPPGGP